MPHLGFQRVRYGGVRGYIVVQRSGDEIREIQKIMAVSATVE